MLKSLQILQQAQITSGVVSLSQLMVQPYQVALIMATTLVFTLVHGYQTSTSVAKKATRWIFMRALVALLVILATMLAMSIMLTQMPKAVSTLASYMVK